MPKPNLYKMFDEKASIEYVHQAIEAEINNHDFIADVYTRSQVDSLLNLKPGLDHTHSIYYTSDRVNELLTEKAPLIHEHNDLYVTLEDLQNYDKSDLGGIGTGENLNGTQIINRGGTTDEHTVGEGFVGAAKEITIDTTNWTIRVHDGATKGGHELVKLSVFNNEINALKEKTSQLDVVYETVEG